MSSRWTPYWLRPGGRRTPTVWGLKDINVETDRRGFIPVNDKMQVIDANGKPLANVFCIGDANGKYMLAHAASSQGISAVENMCGNPHVLDHRSIPAACFTHPEVSFVGLTEEAAREEAEKEGFADKLEVVKTAFKANSKALAEIEGDGMGKLIFRKDTGQIIGCHLIGLHAADMIHEFSNAISLKIPVQDLMFTVHSHPTHVRGDGDVDPSGDTRRAHCRWTRKEVIIRWYLIIG